MKPVILALTAAKGGVGRSLLATNLAVVLAAKGHPTALLDLAPACQGTLDLYLGLSPERSWADLLPVITELEPRHLDLTLARYSEPPLALLATPSEVRAALMFPERGLEPLFRALGQHYAAVVVDLPLMSSRLTYHVLRWATVPMVVVTPDLPAMRNTKRWLQTLNKQQPWPWQVVVNQYARRAPMTLREIKTYLKASPDAVLPYDAVAAWQTVGLGRPFVLRRRRGLAGAVRRWAQQVLAGVESKNREAKRA